MSTGIQPSNYQCRTNGHDPRGWTVGFPAKRKNRKKKFFTTISLYFHISKMRNFSGFLRNFDFICFAKKMRNFRELENAKISRKNTKFHEKILQNLWKNNAKILRKKLCENFAKKWKLCNKTKILQKMQNF